MAGVPGPPHSTTQVGDGLEGTIIRNTQPWAPGGHTLRVRAIDQTVIGNDVFHCYGFEKYFYVQVNNNLDPNPSLRYATADDMAALIAVPASAPVVLYSVKFFGPYAAGQPYTGGTAAGLDANIQPASARQMDTGVLLTTGLFSTWNGDDTTDDRSHAWSTPGWSTPTDKLIHDRIPGAYNRDAVTLEFDVNCLATDASGLHSQLEMELQYGSEEYPEHIGDPDGMGYDAFAVTVDGTLISLVPDGGAPISARSIHPVIPAGSSPFTGAGQIDALRSHLYLDDDDHIKPQVPAANSQVDFDGMSVRLRLHAFVSPGVHKIRISIADRDYPNVGPLLEAQTDSGVFLRAGSLRTIAPTP